MSMWLTTYSGSKPAVDPRVPNHLQPLRPRASADIQPIGNPFSRRTGSTAPIAAVFPPASHRSSADNPQAPL